MKRDTLLLIMWTVTSIFLAFCFSFLADIGSGLPLQIAMMMAYLIVQTFLLLLIMSGGDIMKLKHQFHRRKKNDEGSSAPVAFLLVAVAVFGFETVIFGGDLVESSIYATLEFEDCSEQGFFDTAACAISNGFKAIANVFLILASVIRFLFNALTFNVPGAPVAVRVLFGAAFTAGIGWPIANLIRGSSA